MRLQQKTMVTLTVILLENNFCPGKVINASEVRGLTFTAVDCIVFSTSHHHHHHHPHHFSPFPITSLSSSLCALLSYLTRYLWTAPGTSGPLWTTQGVHTKTNTGDCVDTSVWRRAVCSGGQAMLTRNVICQHCQLWNRRLTNLNQTILQEINRNWYQRNKTKSLFGKIFS